MKGGVELSNSTNIYEVGCYMHVKVCWERNECWREAMMAGEGMRLVYINISAGIRGESWIIIAKAVRKMLEHKAWVISRAQHAGGSRPVRRLSRVLEVE